MWVESEPGEGTTFYFTIQALEAPAPDRMYLLDEQPQLEGKQVLIVDDNATNRLIVARQARSWGMVPRETASPLEALKWLESGERFDIAVLDRRMDELDGYELAAKIKDDPANSALPIILLTSLDGSPAVGSDESILAAHLTKPIKPSQLYNVFVEIFAGFPTRYEHHGQPTSSEFDPNMGRRMPLRILVAEDVATNQKLILRILERLGYEADIAASGIEALEALERQTYDVVLMDVQMPEMDGLEATREILRRWPERRPTIIALTANAMVGDREMFLQAGMDDYLSKPIRVSELVQALEGTFDQQSSAFTDEKLESETEKPAVVLDARAFRQLRDTVGDDDQIIIEFIDAFLEDAPTLIEDLRRAVEKCDASGARLAAHSLKSNSATFGALELSELCRQLEMMFKDGKFEGAEDILALAIDQNARVAEALEAQRETLLGRIQERV